MISLSKFIFSIWNGSWEILRDLDPLQAHDKFTFSHTCHISFQLPQRCFVGKHSKTLQLDIKKHLLHSRCTGFSSYCINSYSSLGWALSIAGCALFLAPQGWANLRQMSQFCSSVSFSSRGGWMCSHDKG